MPVSKSKSNWEGLQLFTDVPNPQAQQASDGAFNEDPLRLAPVVNILYQHLRAALLATDSRQRQLRLGLFGGLGQGKTSAVKQAIARLREELIDRRIRPLVGRPLRVEFFDAAEHKPDLLEFEFDRLISHWYFHRRWGLLVTLIGIGLVLTFLLLHALASLLPVIPGQEILLKTIIPTLISLSVWLFTPVTRFIKQWSRGHLIRDRDTSWQWFVQQNFLPIFFPPDIVVVDNLDRASVPQQRAILRAVRKHSDLLPLPILVVMDETELLQAKPYDAEAPEELLRKVIQVECRMPVRLGDDAALLVMALAAEGAANNSGNPAARLLNETRLQGDWARILTLLRDVSPRRVKRFLNDLLSSCAELDITHSDDVAALSRLYALFSLAPVLRGTGEEVIFALAANDDPSLTALSGKVTPADSAKHVAHFLHLTRHLQPEDANWRRLVAKLTGSKIPAPSSPTEPDPTGAETSAVGLEPQALLLSELDRIGEHLRAVGKGFAGPFVREEAGDSPSFDAVRCWPVVEAVLGAADNAAERWRILVRWETFADQSDAFRFLYRAWLADAEVLVLMSVNERKQLFLDVEKKGFRELLLLVPGQYLHFVDRIVIAATPKLFTQRDVHSIGPWLATGARTPALLEQPPLLSSPGGKDIGLVNLTWPPFTQEDKLLIEESCRDELLWHFTALRVLRQHGIDARPDSLHTSLFERGWLARQEDHIPELLAVLRHLLLVPVVEQPDATMPLLEGRFHLLDVLLLDDRKKQKEQSERSILAIFLDALSRCHPRDLQDDQAWWTGLLIGLYFRVPQVCALWSADILKRKRACKDLRLLEYFASAEMAFLWEEGIFQKEAILTLFGSALDAFTDRR